jgi:hypothetical protein
MEGLPKPKMRYGHPEWCHNHCNKMAIEKLDLGNKCLIIAGSAASVRITRVATTVDEGWFVDWEVVQSQREKAGGRVIFSTSDLRVAFGLLTERPRHEFLEQQYGAQCAVQGTYIRWGNYLNIPCPGTGHDGDPNVSIELSEEIKDAVCRLTGL